MVPNYSTGISLCTFNVYQKVSCSIFQICSCFFCFHVYWLLLQMLWYFFGFLFVIILIFFCTYYTYRVNLFSFFLSQRHVIFLSSCYYPIITAFASFFFSFLLLYLSLLLILLSCLLILLSIVLSSLSDFFHLVLLHFSIIIYVNSRGSFHCPQVYWGNTSHLCWAW